jgi:hypothetical protein
MKKVICVLVAAVLLGFQSPAGAEDENQRFVIVRSGTSQDQKVKLVAAGPITGVGEVVEVPEQPDDPENVFRDEFVFPQGTLSLVFTRTTETFEFDPHTCVGSVESTSTFEVIGGTGAFADATGSGTSTRRGRFVTRRTPAGCSEDEGRLVVVARLTGTVAVPHQAAA